MPIFPDYGRFKTNTTMQENTNPSRFDKGWEKLKEIDGQAGIRVIESLQDVSPDLGKYTIEPKFVIGTLLRGFKWQKTRHLRS